MIDLGQSACDAHSTPAEIAAVGQFGFDAHYYDASGGTRSRERTEPMMERNWIVVTGQLVNTVKGGGFDFLGPYTENEAETIKRRLWGMTDLQVGALTMAVELLRIPDDRIDD